MATTAATRGLTRLCCFSALLLLPFLLPGALAEERFYEFVVQETLVKRLCKTQKIITVNGQFPGPTIEVYNGDTLAIKAVNMARYNVTLHWHGVRQLRNGWADGPEFVTQCPIKPGGSYTYRFTIQEQEGTLWWHAHSSWLRATVHGALIIHPKRGVPYPFPKPNREFPVILGEWWRRDPIAVLRQSMITGAPPNVSDAFLIDGQPGDFLECSSQERRSSFMNWLCAFLNGPKHGEPNRQRPRVTTGEESTLWREEPNRQKKEDPPRNDNEELDRAIALSLAEDAKNPKERNRNKGDNDDDLVIQDSLNMNPYYTPYNPHAPSQALPRGYRVYGVCKHEIGHGHYLSCMGMHWHPQCFRCSSCGHPIRETEFTLLGADPYHKLCYKELHHPKCDVCLQFIPTNRTGLIEYRAHPFWGQKYCPLHEHDSTPRCYSCEKMEPRNTKYMSLGDGRSLCMECLDSAIMDTGECQPLYRSIRDYYKGMNMKLDQQIPMLQVERHALNEDMEGESKGPHHMPETRGLCLSEEQTESSILRRPRIGGNRLLGMRTQPQKLTRRCEVTAILVLYGLPRLLTGSILAHELMHGWLRLKGYRNLKAEVEEGICQVMSYLWLESEILPASSSHLQPSSSYASSSSSSYRPPSSKKGGISHTEKKLGEFFMHQIANDTSTAYGDGFRTAYAAINKYGLRQTLNHIRLTQGFPV